ncbi:MAG TPA: beta-ketoacyl synthase N-terminal-like domain-containing protein, partial [Ramlibacter sp.]
WQPPAGMTLLCGGEPLPEDLRRRMLATGASAWNLYGPTETTIWSTIARVADDALPVHVGRPIANTEVLVIDHCGQLAPVGLPGELCIAGDGLARGYWNQPALTAERFASHPFQPHARLYRTGDLARWRADGVLEHLGRVDHQVKIRGHRVELGEIEAWLDRHDGVQASAVVAREHLGTQQLVAWYVRAPGAAVTQADLAQWLARQLPDYMVPALCVAVPELPLTPSGKVDRKALMARSPEVERPALRATPRGDLEAAVLALWQELLQVRGIGVDDGFFASGGDSVSAVLLAQRISSRFGLEFRAPELFRHSTVREIALHLAQREGARVAAPARSDVPLAQAQAAPAPDAEALGDSLAIIGIACRFPGADDAAAFWQQLREGREGSVVLSREELLAAGVPAERLADPNFVPVRYCMAGRDDFDAGFFNISPRNASFMDPQFRALLQHAWLAVEDAGYRPDEIPDTAVFMSASNGFYKTLLHEAGTVAEADAYAAWIAGQGGSIPTMVSYQLGLQGPSLAVHSNCSSSLVGLYLAQQCLRSGEARQVLVGGATLFAIPEVGHQHQPGLNFSSDGHCRAFDAEADGLVGGEGVAVVMLKRAIDAVADGDAIYALVRGVGVNNDGADKAGFYAPSVRGQSRVIRKVLDATGIHPESIGYMEAHGTGTRLGDPVEVMALGEAWRHYTDKRQFCRLGSVKPNIGHLDTAAGLAGLVKVVMSLRHGEIPPSLHFRTPNPEIDFAASPFAMADRLLPWPAGEQPRRAALSSFGIGGTNAHAILEEAPVARATPVPDDVAQLVVLSARTEPQLREVAQRLLAHLERHAEVRLADVAFTLQRGRKPLAWRFACNVRQREELVTALRAWLSGSAPGGCHFGEVRDAVLVDEQEDADALVTLWLARGRLDKLARAWVQGLAFDWQLLPQAAGARRIHLPAYPFARERHWVDTAGAPAPAQAFAAEPVAGRMAQPVWRARAAAPGDLPARTLLVVCGQLALQADALRALLPPATQLLALTTDGSNAAEAFTNAGVHLLEALRPLVAESDPGLVQLLH